MLTMPGSVSTEINVGTRQGMLSKVMEAKNKKRWKYIDWFVYLCKYLFIWKSEKKKKKGEWTGRRGKGQLTDKCKMQMRLNIQEHSKIITHVQRCKSKKPTYILL